MIEIIMPFPPAILSPNARPHWAAKAKAVKSYRHTGYLAAMIADKGSTFPFEYEGGEINLWIDFHPPSSRRMDDDNALSRFKSGRDGIADYLGVDDSVFISHPMIKEKIAGGCVKVRITAGTE